MHRVHLSNRAVHWAQCPIPVNRSIERDVVVTYREPREPSRKRSVLFGVDVFFGANRWRVAARRKRTTPRCLNAPSVPTLRGTQCGSMAAVTSFAGRACMRSCAASVMSDPAARYVVSPWVLTAANQWRVCGSLGRPRIGTSSCECKSHFLTYMNAADRRRFSARKDASVYI